MLLHLNESVEGKDDARRMQGDSGSDRFKNGVLEQQAFKCCFFGIRFQTKG